MSDPGLHPVPRIGRTPPTECGWELDADFFLSRVASLSLGHWLGPAHQGSLQKRTEGNLVRTTEGFSAC